MNWLLSSYHDAKTHIARNAQSQRDGKFPHSLNTIKGEIFTMETEISRTRGLWYYEAFPSQQLLDIYDTIDIQQYWAMGIYGMIVFKDFPLELYGTISCPSVSFLIPCLRPPPLIPLRHDSYFPVFFCVYIWTSLQYLVSLFLLVSVLPSLF